MEKVIIQNDTDIPIFDVFPFVNHVIKMGRISNSGKQYCYLTAFKFGERDIHVVTYPNKKSDRFIIYEVTT